MLSDEDKTMSMKHKPFLTTLRTILNDTRALDDELAMDFRGEVLMLAALRHPNVCLFMGACLTPPNRAIVTEILNRGSLWEALRNNRLPQVTTPCGISYSYYVPGIMDRVLWPFEDNSVTSILTLQRCERWYCYIVKRMNLMDDRSSMCKGHKRSNVTRLCTSDGTSEGGE